jgi:3-isopropylmalate/(R)-2-methylmalate dehydratase small subunit
MHTFNQHTGIVAPLDRSNIDTDAIIPKQFLKSISRNGFGQHLFDEWRYLDMGYSGQDCTQRPLNMDFILNKAPYQQASILLTRANFGCGSSREHAPWALIQYGIRAVIASSFADIFFSNAYKNHLLPIVLPEEHIEQLFQIVIQNQGHQLSIDLPQQKLISAEIPQKQAILEYHFNITSFRKHCLVNGLDEIGLSLMHQSKIKAFEQNYFSQYPWLTKGIHHG